eukprot:PhM_4_TR13581/c1_g1_i1/m.13019/K11995/DNASE1L; deoxyribonuclease-1-like protein
MNFTPRILCAFIVISAVCFITLTTATPTKARSRQYTIGSFNVQVFGSSKSAKHNVMDLLVRLFRRYDIACMMEIRDKSGDAIQALLAQLNAGLPASQQYGMVLTSRRGRTSSQEQEAYLYRKALFANVSYFEATDDGDTFEREPCAVGFEELSTRSRFLMMCEHVQPSSVESELDRLQKVYEHAKKQLGIPRGFLCGDFNADCSYLSQSARDRLSLRRASPEKYTWLLPDNTDTTVSNSDCSYDHFVIDRAFSDAYEHSTKARAFRFDDEYKLSLSTALTVSDHYPIEFNVTFKSETPPKATPTPAATTRPATTGLSRQYTIGSFNVQVFGSSKSAKHNVMDLLVRLFRRYDIACMMEIRDKSGDAIQALLAQLNAGLPASQQYGMVLTSRRGRTSSQEQEAYLYRKALFA